jgi:hypothetical protein
MNPKELMFEIIKILAQYPTLENMPAGEWNRIDAIIKQAKSEWENRAYPDTEADGYVFCGKCGKMT